jgi:hypothetical protein
MRLLFLFFAFCSFLKAHEGCCNHKPRKWSSKALLSLINRSSSDEMANKGFNLDHSTVSASGPLSYYCDATAALLMETTRGADTRKISLHRGLEELSLKTTKAIHEKISLKIGRFASSVRKNCCDGFFVEHSILDRSFLGGHLIDNGMHVDYNITHRDASETTIGFESLEGKGLMPEIKKGNGLFIGIIRHARSLANNHFVDLSVSYLLNTLYNQSSTGTNNHIGCCQGSSYTGKHIMMANLELASKFQNDIDSNLLIEVARVHNLAERFGKNNHHAAYSLGQIFSFKNLKIGILQIGMRYDDFSGIDFCPCDGIYKTTIKEKTAMLGWKPSENHLLRFEYTHQTKHSKSNNIFKLNYTLKISFF